jgi:hypothetical protein
MIIIRGNLLKTFQVESLYNLPYEAFFFI